MRIGIVSFSALNEDEEIVLAVKRAGMQPENFLWNEVDEKISECAGYILIGDFSASVVHRSGIVKIKSEAHLGKPVLGMGQGTQMLLEAGVIPGLEDDKPCVTLADTSQPLQHTHMRLFDQYQLNAFTRHLKPKNILVVSAPSPKKYFVIAPALCNEMQMLGSTIFYYCDAAGKVDPATSHIAAISNKTGNVMGMIQYPEFTPDSDLILVSMRDYIQSGYVQQVAPMNYYPW
jgi:phosphoribosylformylglycinamidine synthase